MSVTNRQVFLSHVAQTSDFPLMLEIEKAKGSWMFSFEGKKYLDLIAGIGVSSVGHCHPHVVKAVCTQAEQYMHLMVYGEFVQNTQTKLAAKLREYLPTPIDCIYFVNSGSEAVEGALKLAKRYTGKSKLVSCHNAYHGSTHGALSVSGSEHFKQNFRPLLPGVTQIRHGQIDDLHYIDEQTAAVIIEPVQGEAGIKQSDTAYFKALRERCDITGTLLIADEIQSGFGRTGKFWAFEHYDFIPDMILSAKAMGGGMPIGAFMAPQHIMAKLKNNPILGHITTFGGHPVSCAASLAAIEVIEQERLIESVELKAMRFRLLLDHPEIIEIRNKGLMMAVEFESFDRIKKIIQHCLEMGLMTDWFLYCDNSLRIAPPLTISMVEIDFACDVIIKSINRP